MTNTARQSLVLPPPKFKAMATLASSQCHRGPMIWFGGRLGAMELSVSLLYTIASAWHRATSPQSARCALSVLVISTRVFQHPSTSIRMDVSRVQHPDV